jgi:hypothetical protein
VFTNLLGFGYFKHMPRTRAPGIAQQHAIEHGLARERTKALHSSRQGYTHKRKIRTEKTPAGQFHGKDVMLYEA